MKPGEYADYSYQAKRVRRGIRDRARQFLRRRALSALARFRPEGTPAVRCLYSHYVYDDQVALFEQVIAHLSSVGTFVDTPTLMGMLRDGVTVDKNYFHLSFDDGFHNVVSNALPVLERYGVPAILFVATSFVGADWEDARRYSVDITNNGGAIRTTGWADLRQAVAKGFEVGSHTANHARLSQVGSVEKLRAEIDGSKATVEEMLQADCNFISWPFGTAADINDAAFCQIAEAGFHGCFSAIRGAASSLETDLLRIPRHQIEFSWPKSHIEYFAMGGGE